MAFLTAYHTDVGIKKKTNQDGLLLKTAKTPKGHVGLFVICDGMGGLSHGELASSTVIRGMSDWFDTKMPELVASDQFEEDIFPALETCVFTLNEKLITYSEESNVKLGTTLLALIVFASKYYLVHVGDSRAYRITTTLTQLTMDQTLVAREVERGNITEEQAKVDPRRNVLLQCVGATKDIEIEFHAGEIKEDTVFMLCSDGFYHEIKNEELHVNLHHSRLVEETQMKEKIVELVELVKERKEVDNISVIVIKVM